MMVEKHLLDSQAPEYRQKTLVQKKIKNKHCMVLVKFDIQPGTQRQLTLFYKFIIT